VGSLFLEDNPDKIIAKKPSGALPAGIWRIASVNSSRIYLDFSFTFVGHLKGLDINGLFGR